MPLMTSSARTTTAGQVPRTHFLSLPAQARSASDNWPILLLLSPSSEFDWSVWAILPIRSAARHMKHRKHRSRTAAVIGDGVALRQDQPTLARIAQLHDQILQSSRRLVPEVQARFASVAHSLVDEVATLLEGELPVGPAEVDYVEARAEALAELAATANDPRIVDGDLVRRRAVTEARIEVERASGGSALTDTADLRYELCPDPDA